MLRESFLHVIRARLERRKQVAVPALEVLQNVRELGGDGFRIESENPLYDVVCTRSCQSD